MQDEIQLHLLCNTNVPPVFGFKLNQQILSTHSIAHQASIFSTELILQTDREGTTPVHIAAVYQTALIWRTDPLAVS